MNFIEFVFLVCVNWTHDDLHRADVLFNKNVFDKQLIAFDLPEIEWMQLSVR